MLPVATTCGSTRSSPSPAPAATAPTPHRTATTPTARPAATDPTTTETPARPGVTTTSEGTGMEVTAGRTLTGRPRDQRTQRPAGRRSSGPATPWTAAVRSAYTPHTPCDTVAVDCTCWPPSGVLTRIAFQGVPRALTQSTVRRTRIEPERPCWPPTARPHHFRTSQGGIPRAARGNSGSRPSHQPIRRRYRLTCAYTPGGARDSQAQSAGSIPVTRSTLEPQVRGMGLACCLDQFRPVVPFACPNSGKPCGQRPVNGKRFGSTDWLSRMTRPIFCDLDHSGRRCGRYRSS